MSLDLSLDLGLAGSVLVVTWLAVVLAGRLTRRRAARAAAAVAGALVAFAPLDGLALHGFVRGHLADLSATSLVLLALGVCRRLGGPDLPASRDRRVLLGSVLVLAFFLYPFSLGLTRFDPYALGYGSRVLVGPAGAAAIAGWLLRLPVSLACLVAALLGYGFGLGESGNLWDYLLDPWVALYAGGRTLAGVYESRRSLQISVNGDGAPDRLPSE